MDLHQWLPLAIPEMSIPRQGRDPVMACERGQGTAHHDIYVVGLTAVFILSLSPMDMTVPSVGWSVRQPGQGSSVTSVFSPSFPSFSHKIHAAFSVFIYFTCFIFSFLQIIFGQKGEKRDARAQHGNGSGVNSSPGLSLGCEESGTELYGTAMVLCPLYAQLLPFSIVSFNKKKF